MSLSLIDLQSTYFSRLDHPRAKDAVNTATWQLPLQRQVPPGTALAEPSALSMWKVEWLLHPPSEDTNS